MNRMKIGAAGLAAAMTALIIPATAHAGEQPVVVEAVLDRPVVYVSYADLNLSEQAGLERLNRRVRAAATRLCIEPGRQSIADETRDIACRDDALENASRQIEIAVASFGTSQYAAAAERKIAVALR